MFFQIHHDEQDRVQVENLLAVTYSSFGLEEHEHLEERENCC